MPTRKHELVELTGDHLKAFSADAEGPVYGLTLLVDGDPVAIGGYVDHGEALELFSYSSEPPPLSFFRGCQRMVERARETGKPGYAFQGQPGAERLLQRLGLTFYGEYEGELVWRV